MPQAEWFIGHDGRRLGPYSDRVIRELAGRGRLARGDLLWTPGMERWQRADECAALNLFDAAPTTSAESSAAFRPASSAPAPTSTLPAKLAPTSTRNYFARHWRGDLPLPVAYWVNLVLFTLLFIALTSVLTPEVLTDGFGATGTALFTLGVIAGGLGISIWQITGVWRSARKHTDRGGSRGWAVVAQVMLVLGVVRVCVVEVQQVPLLKQSATLLLQGDTMPKGQLRLLNRGTEIEIAGGLQFGTADKLRTLLDANPSVHLVQLNSIGGWVTEGAKLESLIESRGLTTYTGTECDSACLLAFMGGKERLLGPSGRLGFHQTSIGGVAGTGPLASDRYWKILRQRGIPEDIINHALQTPPTSIWYPTTEQLLSASVITARVDGRNYAVSGVRNWQDPAALEAQFRATPAFAAVEALDPTLFERLKAEYVKGIQDGVAQGELLSKLRQPIMKQVLPRAMRHGPDAELTAYWKAELQDMRELRELNPRYCAEFAFPTPTTDAGALVSYVSKKTMAADLQAFSALLRATASSPADVPTRSQVQQALAQAAARAEHRFPGAINAMTHAEQARLDSGRLCNATLAVYDSILELPAQSAGPILRYLDSFAVE